ncbi:unnamed protein product [Rotaria sordida]|uniref:Uncharacterized protein n=1 Tax=Rotaria sordida TaxID=392033 RepID=A0A814L927_9BILA|nr:unnamed protein product [Rotaria sordida]CAF1234993.1 unnamed protein product [Rotaria sordida]
MNDTEFLAYLLSNKDSTSGVALRVENSIFDTLRDDQLKQQTEIDKEWEILMVSGPIIIRYMGNLMVIASKRDFSLQAPLDYVYRYIRYPKSFRATLAQASSDMYNALIGAHTAMDSIQSAMQQVPTSVKTAMKLITSASPAILKEMLPRIFDSIGRSATQSANQANSTLQRFNLLQELLVEIIQLSEHTQGANEVAIYNMEAKKNQSILDQECLQNNLNSIQNQYNTSKAALGNVRKKYVEAVQLVTDSSMPTILGDQSDLLTYIITIAIGVVFNPVDTIGCILGSCNNSEPILDTGKFENAMKIAEQARHDLEKAEQLHNEHFQQQLAEQNELVKAVGQMAMLDLSIFSKEEVVRLLLKVMQQISLFKEQWSRMIRFFSKLAAQVQSTQQIIIKDFLKVIEIAETNNLSINAIDRKFFTEILIRATTTIETGAHLLFTMAKTYYAVSSEHMSAQMAGISQLLLLQTDEARIAHIQQASNETITTLLMIIQMAQERHSIYLQKTRTRQAEYTAYMTNLAASELSQSIG